MSGSSKPETIRLPLPIRSLGHVNVYLDGSTLVDAGMATGQAVIALAKRARGLGLHRVERIVLTHFHVDHASLAPLIAGLTGAEILIGSRELDEVLAAGSVEDFIEAILSLYRRHGVPSQELEEMKRAHPALRLASAYEALLDYQPRRLRSGDRIPAGGGRRLTVIEAPGHTPGSIVLQAPGYSYTGDTILPRITPHVTLHDEHADPLGEYLETLEKLAGTLRGPALPGHRDPLPDPAARARELIQHHRERLREIHEILCHTGPQTARQLAARVKWRTRYSSWQEYPPAEKFFAIGETLAHLRRLELEGKVEKRQERDTIIWRPHSCRGDEEG